MITLRRNADRGHFDFGWLDTRHTFSFGEYRDPAHDGFRALRVINEDRVQPGQGFGTHGHRDMEILTWVLSGALEHRDSMGNTGVIRPGDAQRMSAGTGIRHSEFNASDQELVHFLQIWVLPERSSLTPSYEQKHFPRVHRQNRLRLIASHDGREDSVRWHQDAELYAGILDPGQILEPSIGRDRHIWIQMARGSVKLGSETLLPGDGASLSDEATLRIEALTEAEVLVFNLA